MDPEAGYAGPLAVQPDVAYAPRGWFARRTVPDAPANAYRAGRWRMDAAVAPVPMSFDKPWRHVEPIPISMRAIRAQQGSVVRVDASGKYASGTPLSALAPWIPYRPGSNTDRRENESIVEVRHAEGRRMQPPAPVPTFSTSFGPAQTALEFVQGFATRLARYMPGWGG